jgi:Integrase core domain/GAG-pre-integrase domain
MQNVYFIPDLSQNLLSIGQLIESGYSIVFEGKSCKIRDKDKLVIEDGMVRNRLFPLEIIKISDKALAATTNLSESELWHLRYDHLSIGGLRLLKQKQMVYGLPEISEFGLCEGCILGKHYKLPFVKGQSLRATQLLELVHTDLCGPMDTSSLGGSMYFLLFIDDFSRMNWVYFLQTKGEAFKCFKKFKGMVETQSGMKIKKIRSDRGGEYQSNEFKQFCENEGIIHQLTLPYTPQQNMIVKRKNKTIVELARSMLTGKRLPHNFWAEVVATAVYLLNITPTKAVFNITPYEAWHGRKTAVGHLKVFGCVAYSMVNSQNRRKLDEKFEKDIFIGYCQQSKGYKIYIPDTKKTITRRNVIFVENSRWIWENETKESVPMQLNSDEVVVEEGDLDADSEDDANVHTPEPHRPQSHTLPQKIF